uniref:NADH:ubiquinone reductase (H(+)-translocating) n=1 Tax=Benedenia seriolae TaxID=160838 RepID=A0A499VUD6_BENSE|nr:NADH dehydrogenase subunit 5 [Benedenia seriolae]BBJ70625.1 NADH dehydrogenase subunit 5 [Benedenia seriolae]BBJ70637.1 NADH dehydrogenase subunit 5 [Benedenia seriolae]BBJ70649.1 NADH dehydrogenase subunit 5 [Benedenia seriolae]BBJ70661.1 NADH dehydrogenase subunit 5 [Benedenia seriolae]
MLLWPLLFFCVNIFIIQLHYNSDFSSGLFNHFDLDFNLSSVSNYYIIMLSVCGLIVLYYNSHYFSWQFNYLNFLILFFLSIMCYLIITSSFFNTLIAWEFLGVVSFILILFYSNYDTSRAANITLISSRFGDVGLFCLLSLAFFNWNVNNFFSLSFLIIVISKSAIFPLGSWLLEAMRAPTPVSCLVHSSTLVAAGVWFILNYIYILDSSILESLYILSLATIIYSSLSSLYYLDLKKLIALSTCNNISWCIVYLCCHSPELCLIQLVSHGVGKCMLFAGAGDVFNNSGGSQLNSATNNKISGNLSNIFICSILVLFISGLPFLGVYFSKHVLLTSSWESANIFFILILNICFICTYIYSMRLFLLLSKINTSQNSGFTSTYHFSAPILVISCIINFFYSCCNEEIIILDSILSFYILCLQFFGLFLGWVKYTIYSRLTFNLYFMGQDFLILIWNKVSSFTILFIQFISNFRFERFINNISFNINLLNFNFFNVITISIFFLFFLLTYLIF